MPTRLSIEKEKEICQRYTTQSDDGTWDGATIIGRELGVSTQAVYNLLKRNGMPTRSRKESHSGGKRTKPIKNLPVGDNPFCACNCGELVAWNRRKNRWNKFVEGHYQKEKPYHSKDWLEREYSEHGRSAEDIASEIGVSSSSVRKFLRKHNIQTRPNGVTLLLSGKMKGPNNPAWKGGIARDYPAKWKELSRKIRLRDNNTCLVCHRTADNFTAPRPLHVHHIDYDKANNETNNLITLCTDCHHAIPEGDPGWSDVLAKLIKQ